MKRVPDGLRPRYRVGLRLLDWMEGFGIRLFSGILDFLRESGHDWEICYEKPTGGDLPSTAIDSNWTGDGLIVFRHSEQEAELWRKRGVKVINLSAETPDAVSPFPRLTMDPVALANIAASHLSSLGLRQLAYWHDPDRLYSQERWGAFQAAAQSFGCEVHEIRIPACRQPFSKRAGRIADLAWRSIAKLPKPCGLFAKDDIAATAAMQAIRKIGLRCPQDIAILSINDDPIFCETERPAISSIRYPGRRAGRSAARLLQQLMDGSRIDDGSIRIRIPPGPLVRRESTGLVELSDPLVGKAMAIIHAEAARKSINITDLARRVGVSRELLRQRFNTALGHGPKMEADLRRLTWLENQLSISNDTLEAIAETSGFCGADDLSRFFKRLKGLSPGEFRRDFRASR
jgi:LacI family transcriptional regulator